MQFDLTSIPTNTNGVPTVIVNATMKLYAYESLRQTTQAVGTDDSGNNPLLAGFTTGWVHWDVTSLVQGWFANTQDPSKGFLNNGVLITINTADYLSFVSKENKNFNNSFYPQLIVTYQ